MDDPTRRRYLLALGTASAGLLAGCPESEQQPGSSTAVRSPPPTSRVTTTERSTRTDTETSDTPTETTTEPRDQPGPERATTTGLPDGVAWRYDVDTSSAPTVVDGTLYFGGGDWLYALSESQGIRQWATEAELAQGGDPRFLDVSRVVDGALYATHTNGFIYGVDAGTGAVLWRESGDWGPSAPLTVDIDSVFAPRNNSLHAYDRETGTERWSYQIGSRQRDDIFTKPAVGNGLAYAGGGTRKIHAIDVGTGEQQWAYETDGMILSSDPTLVGETLYVGSLDGSVYALDTASGRKRWSYDTTTDITTAPAVSDGTLYVANRDSELFALDATTGEQQWITEIAAAHLGGPVVVNGHVYLGSRPDDINDDSGTAPTAQRLLALDPASGETVWAFDAIDGVSNGPVLTEDRLYVTDLGGRLYALARPDL